MDFFELDLGKILTESSLNPLDFVFDDNIQRWKLDSQFADLQFRFSPVVKPIMGFDVKSKRFSQVKEKLNQAFVFFKWEGQVALYDRSLVTEVIFEGFIQQCLRMFVFKEDGILQFSDTHSVQYKTGRLCIVSNKKLA